MSSIQSWPTEAAQVRNVTGHLSAQPTPSAGTASTAWGHWLGFQPFCGGRYQNFWLQMCSSVYWVVKVFAHSYLFISYLHRLWKRFSGKAKQISIRSLVRKWVTDNLWYPESCSQLWASRNIYLPCVNCGGKNPRHAWHEDCKVFIFIYLWWDEVERQGFGRRLYLLGMGAMICRMYPFTVKSKRYENPGSILRLSTLKKPWICFG